MMILLAVILGYVLGIAPFLLPKINIRLGKKSDNDEEIRKEQTQILDEYLNGTKGEEDTDKNSTYKEIFEEYLTGIPKGGN